MNYPPGTFGYERQRIEREAALHLKVIVDTIALLERKDYRGEEISMLVMDECQTPRSASAPPQDAATELTVADAHSTA